MCGLGLPELLVVLVVVLLVFGTTRLPELGASLGKGIRNFRKAMREPDAIDVTPASKKDEDKSGKTPPAP